MKTTSRTCLRCCLTVLVISFTAAEGRGDVESQAVWGDEYIRHGHERDKVMEGIGAARIEDRRSDPVQDFSIEIYLFGAPVQDHRKVGILRIQHLDE